MARLRLLPRIRRSWLRKIGQQTGFACLMAALPLLEAPALRRLWTAAQIRMLRTSPLFDREFYVRTYGEALGSARPVRHYVEHGAGLGFMPHILFDPQFYRDQIGSERERRLNPVIHYLLAGGRRALEPSPWFQRDVYLAENPDVSRARIDPFVHFCRQGMRDNRKASSRFDPRRYLAENGDQLAPGESALEHFLESRAGASVSLAASREALADAGRRHLEWLEALPLPVPSGPPQVDVVVPAYRGFTETLACIRSVLTAQNETPFELIVIDDFSPEPDLSRALRRLADRGLFTLHVNPENRGFVTSANLGLAAHPDRDVILLNSDTEVYGDWMDRLRAAALSRPSIGTVTPMTNNGTICSYPLFCADNPRPLELPYSELDSLFREEGLATAIDLPTAVGFCMYVRREAIEAAGLLDAEAFRLGYGEENDFCLRAQAEGFRDVLAPNVFVRHLGQLSFARNRAAGVERAARIIDRRHPHYRKALRRFTRTDPLRPARQKIDVARLKRVARARNVVMVSHSRGGGAAQHLLEETERLARDGVGIFRLVPARAGPNHVEISHPEVLGPTNLGPFALDRLEAELGPVLRTIGISEAHIHHLIDFAPQAPDAFRRLFESCGIAYRFVVHDYSAVCPRINLIGPDGTYCGEPDERGCASCLSRGGPGVHGRDIRAWRGAYARLLAGAEAVVAPSFDTAARMARHIPGIRVETRYHESIAPAPLRAPRREAGRPLRVGIVGAISRIKGLEVVRACAVHAARHRPDLRFVVVGYTSNDRAMAAAGVEITGLYHQADLQRLLREREIDVVFLPSICPETYSYTLSAALLSGLPLAVFDIGAMPERARMAARHAILPLDRQDDPAFLCEALARLADSGTAAAPVADRAARPLHSAGAI